MTTNWLKSFTSDPKLPIPYIESIEVYNDKLLVQASFYIRMSEQEYLYKDQISSTSMLPDGTMAGLLPRLNWVLQLVMDRGVPDTEVGKQYALSTFWPVDRTDSIGVWTTFLPPEDGGASEYISSYPVNGYLDAANGSASVLESIGHFDEACLFVTSGDIVDLRAIVDSDLLEIFDTFTTEWPFAEWWTPPEECDFFVESGYVHTDDDIGSRDDYSELSGSEREAKLALILQYLLDERMPLYALFERFWAENALSDDDFDARVEMQTLNIVTGDLPLSTLTVASNFASFTETDTYIQTNGDVVIKYTNSVEVFTDAWPALWGRWGDYKLKQMGLLSYSTDMTEAELLEAKGYYDSIDPERFLRAARISESNIVAFQKNGNIVQESMHVYRDSDGIVHKEPLQSIDKLYYGQDKITLEDIISSMATRAEHAAASAAESLRDAGEALQYVLSTNEKNNGILIELNNYRKVFAEKSSITSVGAFYEEFKKLLYSANKIVQSGIKLTKSKVTNPVVKDMRDWSPGDVYAGYYSDYSMANDFIDVESTIWSRTTEVYGFDSSYDGDEYDETDEGAHLGGYKYALVDNGYWFFNYEKALKSMSTLSRIINVTRFEKFFGTKLTNRAFRLGKFSVFSRVMYERDIPHTGDIVLRTHDGTNHNWYTTGIVESIFTYENNFPELDLTIVRSDGEVTLDGGYDLGDYFALYTELEDALTTRSEYSDSTGASSVYGGAFWQDENIERSFLVFRPFQLMSNEEGFNPNLNISNIDFAGHVPHHRYMAFEYQKRAKFSLADTDYASGDTGFSSEGLLENHQIYQFFLPRAYVFDETAKILAFLADLVISAKDSLDEYISAAEDKCAFNDTDGYFNKFFVDAVAARFPDPTTAPYIKVPIIFFMMSDLLYDEFDGALDLIYSSAREMIAGIAPETGTLSALQHFGEMFDTIYDAWTTTSGDDSLYEILSEREDSDWITDYDSISDLKTMFYKARKFGVDGDMDDEPKVFVPTEDYDNYPEYSETEEPADTAMDTEAEIDFDDPPPDDGPTTIPIECCDGTIFEIDSDSSLSDICRDHGGSFPCVDVTAESDPDAGGSGDIDYGDSDTIIPEWDPGP